MSELIGDACRRFPSMGQTEKTARIERLIHSGAWTDAALALIDLELPQWQVRRIAYDEGEWHCALSRERELPDWLDQSIEARHADLALAILSAFVEARRISAPSSRTSVPTVPRDARRRSTSRSAATISPRAANASIVGVRTWRSFRTAARTEIDPGDRPLLPADSSSWPSSPLSAASASAEALPRCCGCPSSSAPWSAP